MGNEVGAGIGAIFLILLTAFAIVPLMQKVTGITVFGIGFTILMVLFAVVVFVAIIVSIFKK